MSPTFWYRLCNKSVVKVQPSTKQVIELKLDLIPYIKSSFEIKLL